MKGEDDNSMSNVNERIQGFCPPTHLGLGLSFSIWALSGLDIH